MRPSIVLYYNDLVFQPSESFLHKDFGQVPHVLAELHDAKLEYWIAATQPNPSLDRFLGHRVRQFAKSGPALPARFDVLRNHDLYRAIAREPAFTHLVIFPFTPATDLAVARRAKRRGVRIILKLDTNVDYLASLAASWQQHGHGWRRFLTQAYHYRELLRTADVVICETSACDAVLRDGFLDLDLDAKLVKTFSGLSQRWFDTLGLADVPDEARRASIIVSGRISSAQKHSETIFAAGPPPPGWVIEFVGSVDADLERVIATYRATDPAFDDHYRFHGAITDKRAYFALLMQARALLLNSRGGEGFPNVFAEAHLCRLLIMTSDVSGADDATDGGKWGIIYAADDPAALRAALDSLPAQADAQQKGGAPEAHRRRFIWEHSLNQPAIRHLFETSGA